MTLQDWTEMHADEVMGWELFPSSSPVAWLVCGAGSWDAVLGAADCTRCGGGSIATAA